ncbi:MAG: outer membrane lipoprotein carrier protein LolA [Parvibaculum sp.]|nr:outer membrane lipoprotein carrier protein LolA [Parvibaculum sp.]
MGNATHPARETRSLARVMKLAALLVLSAAVLPSAVSAAACPSPKDIKVGEVDRAFTQERHIEGMSKPLLSRGRLTADENRIVWHMTEPFDVETVIAPDGITESVDGEATRPVATGTGELGSAVARSAAALMRGNWEELSTLFEVSEPAKLDNGDWQVLLAPRNERMKRAVGLIEVTGCEDVERIEIGSEGGDRHIVTFPATEDAS